MCGGCQCTRTYQASPRHTRNDTCVQYVQGAAGCTRWTPRTASGVGIHQAAACRPPHHRRGHNPSKLAAASRGLQPFQVAAPPVSVCHNGVYTGLFGHMLGPHPGWLTRHPAVFASSSSPAQQVSQNSAANAGWLSKAACSCPPKPLLGAARPTNDGVVRRNQQ
jgi:hypothetical protein